MKPSKGEQGLQCLPAPSALSWRRLPPWLPAPNPTWHAWRWGKHLSHEHCQHRDGPFPGFNLSDLDEIDLNIIRDVLDFYVENNEETHRRCRQTSAFKRWWRDEEYWGCLSVMLCSSEEMNSYNHMDFKLLRQSLLHNTAGCLILILHYIFSSIFNYSHAAIVVHENIMSPLFVCYFFFAWTYCQQKKKENGKKETAHHGHFNQSACRMVKVSASAHIFKVWWAASKFFFATLLWSRQSSKSTTTSESNMPGVQKWHYLPFHPSSLNDEVGVFSFTDSEDHLTFQVMDIPAML